jgi:phosphohistidine phosphatase SixA
LALLQNILLPPFLTGDTQQHIHTVGQDEKEDSPFDPFLDAALFMAFRVLCSSRTRTEHTAVRVGGSDPIYQTHYWEMNLPDCFVAVVVAWSPSYT